MSMSAQVFADGGPFPVGHFELLPHHVWLWTDAVEGRHELGILPSVACFVALSGAGISIQGLMDLLGTEPRHVLFGEIEIDLASPLRPGAGYDVTTSIVGIERKTGGRIPVFDRVSIVYRLLESGDQLVATVRQGWIVTRQGEARP
ncbi:hypothetical protein HRJ34_17090 [Rhizorhabdus wittichii]|uniref:Uncharacterized protein n=1 Tax=Rhizorhabdus wittichii TaxID=160791 RepID=A0A975D1M9_9SPHN|nr:hypothetical protein [Rhizorhabdus wittichii]QTH20065.1 hypothetical protein HRJ34_17090 [Rhizorhabdus wittichii]